MVWKTDTAKAVTETGINNQRHSQLFVGTDYRI